MFIPAHTQKGKDDPGRATLASLYEGIVEPTEPKPQEEKKYKEEEVGGASDLSDEGLLKLFVGGLYFQSESME